MAGRSISCRSCGMSFEAPAGRGRPPVRCAECMSLDPVKAPGPAGPASERMAKARAARGSVAKAPVGRPVGRQAQCVACDRVFSSDSVCEKHKSYSEPKSVGCKDPASLGLVLVGGVWVRSA